MDPLRRKILEAGAAAAAMATASRVLAQARPAESAMTFYEKGPVRIHYEVAGSGFPLMLIAGGGLNSTIAGLKNGSPFNPIDEFKGEYRCIAADLRNANAGHSSGPLEIDRPWDAYTDDHIGLMDHLGIDKFMVLGFCIGGPFIWNLIERAPNRVVAAVLAQPSGSRPELRDLFYDNNIKGWGPELVKRRPEITMRDGRPVPDQDVPHQRRLRLHGDARFRAHLPDAGADSARRHSGASVRRGHGGGDARAEGGSEHVPVEGTEGAHSAGGASDPLVPPRASAIDVANTSSIQGFGDRGDGVPVPRRGRRSKDAVQRAEIADRLHLASGTHRSRSGLRGPGLSATTDLAP